MSAPQAAAGHALEYDTAARLARQQMRNGGLVALVYRALLAELAARAERLADAAAERAALVRELHVVTGERDNALAALESPNRSDV